MDICIYTLTSELHDEQAINKATSEYLISLGLEYEYKGDDYSDYGSHQLDLIFVRTGGTEGLFRLLLAQKQINNHQLKLVVVYLFLPFPAC